jgi:LuxR family maltose regulon positive regulatory protein
MHTRFYRPSLPSDLVIRTRLFDKLDGGLDRPLILVSAPAGYGKTVLVSSWLNARELPGAWLSLDETIDDFGAFLSYFVAAVQRVFPGALQRTQTLLTGMTLPPIGVLAGSLINELDEIERHFIVVLEDYQAIHRQEIHDLVSVLLHPAARHMHLVLITRKDPPLPQNILLARRQMAEVRLYDLRFLPEEIAAFMRNALGSPLAGAAIAALTEKTEGWITSLRLVALALSNRPDDESRVAELQALERNRNVTDYLISEVFSQTPPAIEDFLLKTVILDRMCGPLCATVLGHPDLAENDQALLDWLEQNNLFTVALDNERRWYRYHHLFRDFLQARLEQRCDADEVARLHLRASAWFIGEGLLEEALKHALLGHDTPAAVSLVAERRPALMNAEQWQILDRFLHMFPADAIMRYPDLTLMAAQSITLRQSGWERFPELLNHAESLLAQMPDPSEHAVHLQGEIDALRVYFAYEATANPEGAIVLAHRALAALPRAWYYARQLAWIFLALTYQAVGRLDQAHALMDEAEPEDVAPDGAVYGRVLGSRLFIQWVAGELPAMARGAPKLRAVCEAHGRLESWGWSEYLLGILFYEWNDLAAAEAHAQSLEDMRYLTRPMAVAHGVFMHASLLQARGLPDEARKKLDEGFDFLRETRSEGLLPLAEAFRADLAARQGDLAAAGQWAATVGPHVPLAGNPYFYAPQVALPKILLAQNTPASLAQADEVLARLYAFFTSIHNTRFTIEVLALQALSYQAQGQRERALAALEQAVTLAQPGGFVRLFLDLGPTVADLLGRLSVEGAARAYVERLQQAFAAERTSPPRQTAPPPAAPRGMIEPLTRREMEVLGLLAQRLTAQEIAQKLILSEQTVNRHRVNIYQKLGVHSRREALATAVALGILPSVPRSGPLE